MPKDGQIDYIELPGPDLPATKRFYSQAFGWQFTDYGPDYAGFRDGRGGEREAGGFHAERKVSHEGPLAVLYAADLARPWKRRLPQQAARLSRGTNFLAANAFTSAIPTATN